MINLRGVWGILSFTFGEAIRTKWLIVLTVAFFLLGVNIPVQLLSDVNRLPVSYMNANFDTLLSGTFTLIPLIALPIGAISIVEDRESGTLQYLLSNPITKSEFFFGRGAGLLLATTAVIFVGFGAAGLVIYTVNISHYLDIVILMLTAALLNAVMLALSLIISEFSKRKATALGIAILFWFLLTTVTDLGTLTETININYGNVVATFFVLLDPVETGRLVTVVAANLNETSQFGSTGYLASYTLGNNMLPVTLGSVMLWLVILTAIGFLVFRHQDAG